MNNGSLNKASFCLFGGALLGAGLISNPANADVHYSGTINPVGHLIFASYGYGSSWMGSNYSYGWFGIDLYGITVTTDAAIIFDTRSFDLYIEYMNPQIMLFSGIGRRFSTENYVAGAGSGPPEGFDTNGSISTADAFMEVFLTRGDYTLAVGTGGFSIDDLDSAPEGDNPFALGLVHSTERSIRADEGYYELDILGPVIHPTPSALTLVGMAGLLSSRRRR